MLTLSSTVKRKPPVSRAFLSRATKIVLGKQYDLTLVFIGKNKSLSLNSRYRNIKKPTDILSFELEKNLGEMYIQPDMAKRKAPLFERSYENYLKFLFIHGLCHLKGMDHGSRMEYQERKFRKLLKV